MHTGGKGQEETDFQKCGRTGGSETMKELWVGSEVSTVGDEA